MRRTVASASLQSQLFLLSSASDAFYRPYSSVCIKTVNNISMLGQIVSVIKTSCWITLRRFKGTAEFLTDEASVLLKLGHLEREICTWCFTSVYHFFDKGWWCATQNKRWILTVTLEERDLQQNRHHSSCCVTGAELWKVNKGGRQLANLLWKWLLYIDIRNETPCTI